MEWATVILAVLGLLYGVLRIVVLRTPTPRDNEALEEVSAFIRIPAKIMGLDLKQGRQKDDGKPPNPVPVSVILTSLLVLTGCGTVSPEGQYLVTQKLYVSTVDVLTAANDAGRLSEADNQKITVLVNKMEEKLNAWANAILADEAMEIPTLMEAANDVLDEMIQYLAELEKRNGRGDNPIPDP